jgi:hypothetical protein
LPDVPVSEESLSKRVFLGWYEAEEYTAGARFSAALRMTEGRGFAYHYLMARARGFAFLYFVLVLYMSKGDAVEASPLLMAGNRLD